MRRLAAFLLAVCMAFTLMACGGSSEPQQSQGVDVDLTELSSTLVYAEVYNMAANPQDYLGKTVRMRGSLVYQVVNDQPNPDYLACLISDATACCAQGIEFVLAQPLKEYPQLGSMVTVTGVFSTYQSNDMTYLRLEQASMEPDS